MQKINNNFLTLYYETFSFLMPRIFSANEQLISFKFKNWVLMDSFKHAMHLRTILKILKKLNEKNNEQGLKFLFVIDESLLPFFKKFLIDYKCFFTDNVKEALFFINSKQSQSVSSVIYIGSFDNFSENLTKAWKCPAFFFTPKALSKSSYTSYNSLNFQGSILLLQSFLVEALTTYDKNI